MPEDHRNRKTRIGEIKPLHPSLAHNSTISSQTERADHDPVSAIHRFDDVFAPYRRIAKADRTASTK